MFGFDEDLVADFEVWCWRSVFVGGDLVLFLSVGDHQSELLVEFFEVHYKVVGERAETRSCSGWTERFRL